MLGLDLLARGWSIVYADDIVTHHYPSSTGRDVRARLVALARNRLWLGCLRLPWRTAWDDACRTLHEAARHHVLAPALLRALPGLPWALRHRHVVPQAVAAAYRAVHLPHGGATPLPPHR